MGTRIKMIGGRKTPIDPEIKSLIVELNKNGFITTGSCAGHGKYGSGLGEQRKGYVWFERPIDKNNKAVVVSLMKKHGCKEIRFAHSKEARFAPMGKIATQKEMKDHQAAWKKIMGRM